MAQALLGGHVGGASSPHMDRALRSDRDLEPDEVAGDDTSAVPVGGELVEQLQAAAGDRVDPPAVAPEGEGRAGVADLDVEQAWPERDAHLEGPVGVAGGRVEQRVGDGLVHEQPGRLVGLRVAQQGAAHELPYDMQLVEPPGELSACGQRRPPPVGGRAVEAASGLAYPGRPLPNPRSVPFRPACPAMRNFVQARETSVLLVYRRRPSYPPPLIPIHGPLPTWRILTRPA